jgi:hypothetical protein
MRVHELIAKLEKLKPNDVLRLHIPMVGDVNVIDAYEGHTGVSWIDVEEKS